MPLYRVTFTHARHRATFEVRIRALTPLDAQDLASLIVARKCRETVGAAGDWCHQETVEVDEKEGARNGRKEKA